MDFRERRVRLTFAPLSATVMLWGVGLTAIAEPAASGGTHDMSAVWTPKEVEFKYQGVTALYTCDGLRRRVKDILLGLGARHDLQVRTLGCTRRIAPERFPSVSIRMNVLQPAGQSGSETVPAHWQKVDVLARHDAVNAAADCELIRQIREKVLPLFATRDVDYSAICQANTLLPGATRLKAEVLVPESGTPAETASH